MSAGEDRAMRTLLFISMLSVVVSAGSTAGARGKLLGVLKDQSFGEGNCGCDLSVQRNGRKLKVFVIDAMQDQQRAMVNLLDADVLVTRRGEPDHSAQRRGDRYSETWTSGAVTIKIDYTITKACGDKERRKDEDCEGIDVQATITASDGKTTQAVKATGYCGC
jgi:hypothetical protein